MIHSFIRNKKNPKRLDKFIYYMSLKKVNYNFDDEYVMIYIEENIYLRIRLIGFIELHSNSKLLSTFVNWVNDSNNIDYTILLRMEDIVFMSLQHLEINKKIKNIELENTLESFKNIYLLKNKKISNYEKIKLEELNSSIKVLNKNKLFKIFSMVDYPKIELIQHHIIDESVVSVYVKYDFFSENPLTVHIDSTTEFKYNLLKKIETLDIFKNWNTWRDEYTLDYINDRIFNIIRKYGKINLKLIGTKLSLLINELEEEMEIEVNSQITENMLTTEIGELVISTGMWSLVMQEEQYNNKTEIINEKINSLFYYLKDKKNNKTNNIDELNSIKNIIKEYFDYYDQNNKIMCAILEFVSENLKSFNKENEEESFIIEHINDFMNSEDFLYKIEYCNENTSNIENKGYYKLTMSEYNKKIKRRKISEKKKEIVISDDSLEEIDLSSNDEKNIKNTKKRSNKNYIIDDDDNFEEECEKYKDEYIEMLNNYKIIECDDFTNFYGIDKVMNSVSLMLRKTIVKEIKLLQKNILIDHKSGIFVCKHSTRKNIIRVAITGPYGTPYENALFIFDLIINNDYPDGPPKLHLSNTGGKRLNPNLYYCGKVCLSLLGTWHGDESEIWNRNTSNISQILISIQSLILVEKPYFNEPGYMDRYDTDDGQKDSRKYSEQVTLYAMNHGINDLINDLQSDFPQYSEFHDIIRNHFKFKRNEILNKMIEWKDNVVNNKDNYKSILYTNNFKKYNDLIDDYDYSIKTYKKLIEFL